MSDTDITDESTHEELLVSLREAWVRDRWARDESDVPSEW